MTSLKLMSNRSSLVFRIPFNPEHGGSGPRTANGPTNEVVKIVNGMKRRRLGGSDIFVSELGLGTQRWVSTDFNAPDRDLCFKIMDEAILKRGVNLIDTAEQYPIPSDGKRASEGDTERVIGDWMKDRKVPRSDVVISTKITGGRNATPRNIQKDCDESLKRLQTDYIDVYLLHWPQRYSPQSNWGQSLKYNLDYDTRSRQALGNPTSFEDLCLSMQDLVQQGKIRGWGLCNDNAFGLTACSRTAKMLGTTPPCTVGTAIHALECCEILVCFVNPSHLIAAPSTLDARGL
jgi:aryl-alcohol dehydrogenase-like predicted oxidoreductase